jgi:hypothetical protein
VPVAGFAGGLWASLTGVTIAVVGTLLVWIFAAGESASDTALRVGPDVWLAAHGVPFRVGEGVWTLMPWMWVVLPSLVIWAAGRWVAHRAAVAYPNSVLVAAVSLAAAYGLVALLAALFGTLSGAGAMPVRAAVYGACLAGVVSGASMMHRAGLGRAGVRRAMTMLRPAAGALAVLLGGSALLLLGALLASHSLATEQLADIRPGPVGVLALFLAWLGYLPAALLWALSYAMGAGIQVGGQNVGPLSQLDESIRMLGLHMVPATTQPWWLLGWLVPLAAGAVLSLLAPDGGRAERLKARALAVAVVLIVTDVWWMISTGRIGAGWLEFLGPSPVLLPMLTAALLAGILLHVAGTWGWARWQNRDVVDLTEPAGDTSDTTA